MAITLNGSTGIGTPGVSSTDAITGTTGAFSGNVTANGLSTELRPLVSGTAVTASGTTVDFTGIPSWAKRVTVLLSGVSTSGTSNPLVQLGSGSFTTSGYAAQASNSSTTTGAAYTTGFGIASAVASNILRGRIVFSNLTGNTWVAEGTGGINAGGTPLTFALGGDVTLSSALDRIRVTTVNGTDTFDAGTINIMYE